MLQPPHPVLDQLSQPAGCPALTVLLTSLMLSFVSPGGQRHPKQQIDAGLVKKLPRGLSPEERKRFAQVDKSVHPQPFAQENQCRRPAAVAGEAGTASCKEAQGLGTSWDGWPSLLPLIFLSKVRNGIFGKLCRLLLRSSKPLRC